MPEIITEPMAFTRGRGSAIPWGDHFMQYQGKVVKFLPGTDFDIKPRSFAVAAQEYAKAQHLGKVQTSVSDDAVILKFPSKAENAAASAAAEQIEGQEAITV